MEIPLPEKKMAYCIIENRRKPFTKIKDLLSLWNGLPVHETPWKFKTTCQLFVFMASLSQIYFLGFSQRARIFFRIIYWQLNGWKIAAEHPLYSMLITTQFIFHLQSNAGEFTQLTRMSARRLLTKANLLAAHKPDLYEQYGGKFWKRSYCGYSKPKHINNHPFLLVWLHLCLGISFCSLL